MAKRIVIAVGLFLAAALSAWTACKDKTSLSTRPFVGDDAVANTSAGAAGDNAGAPIYKLGQVFPQCTSGPTYLTCPGAGALYTWTTVGITSGDVVVTDAGASLVINATGYANGQDAGNAFTFNTTAAQCQGAADAGTVCNDSWQGISVPSNGTVQLYAEQGEAPGTTYDYVINVVCQTRFASDAGGDASAGDVYRADFATTYQRIGTAHPTVVQAAAVPLNVRVSGTGAVVGGASLTTNTVTNSLVVQFAGAIGASYFCSGSINRTVSF